ncbi:hypothetical protein SHEWT2_00730 [Shewanella hafniensis]|nr:hypothetical protein SHEWT2_00730 [Shewanella hafniensis]
MSKNELMEAHKHSSNHRTEILSSTTCGCFYCLSIFPPTSVVEWVDDGNTAICPECDIDSVIGSESGLPISEIFLKEMHECWF